MSTILSSFISQIEISDIQTHDNVAIVQLSGIDPNFPKIVPFAVAYKEQTVKITERKEASTVPEILAVNLSDNLILILEGEILLGAMQNRTINTTILLPPKSNTIIPVSCVERGRWSCRQHHFSPSDLFITPDMRGKKVSSVFENFKRTGRYMSDQHEVWSEVSARLTSAKISSPTDSFEDYQKFLDKNLDDFAVGFKRYTDSTGIVGFIDGNITACDIIPNPEIFGHFFTRLLKSYSIDAFYKDTDHFQHIDYKIMVNNLFEDLKNSKEVQSASPGSGDLIQLKGHNITGSALIYNSALIHCALFETINKNFVL